MSFRKALTSALHFFMIFALFLVSLFFVLLPHLPLTRMDLIDWLTHNYQQSTQIGLGCFLATFVCFLGFYSLEKGKYLVIRMGVSVDLKLVQKAVEECFAKQFFQKISLQEMGLNPKSQLQLTVQLASLNTAEKEALFVEVDRQLTLLLQERFGYTRPFLFTVAKMRS